MPFIQHIIILLFVQEILFRTFLSYEPFMIMSLYTTRDYVLNIISWYNIPHIYRKDEVGLELIQAV